MTEKFYMHSFLLGSLLGLGAAIPIGPVNLEIIRRNLRFGTPYGISTGLGACTADLIYLILLCLGALTLLQYPTLLRIISILGSLILIWFAIGAFRSKITSISDHDQKPSLLRFGLEGFAMTAINPFTILFWASISSQLSLKALTGTSAIFLAGCGVIAGTVSWVLFINLVVHFTRHRLSATMIRGLNYVGGFILLGFAISGIVKGVLM